MTTFVNLHILQPFSYANPNRDDVGSPKAMTYGGVPRARISSQSWKRAARRDFEDGTGQRSWRSKHLGEVLATQVAARLPDTDADAVSAAATAAVSGLTKGTDKSSDKNAAVWLSSIDLEVLADAVARHLTPADPSAKAKTFKASDFVKAVTEDPAVISHFAAPGVMSIAAFGRMFAAMPGLQTEAAVQVAHAFTTHEMGYEVDFFTATEDLATDHRGGAHMDAAEFTGGIYYRFLVIDLDELATNLGERDPELLERFIRSLVLALPTGRQNVTANHESPALVLAEVGPSPVSYAAAFEVPTEPRALDAATRLGEHRGRVRSFLEAEADHAWLASPLELVGFDGAARVGLVSLCREVAELWRP